MAIQKIIESLTVKEYLFFIVLITVVYIFNFYYKYFTRTNPLPGPFPLPFIGNIHNVGLDVRKFYKECRQKYGDTCEVMLMGLRCIVLTRPDDIEKILSPASKGDAYIRRFPYTEGEAEIGHYGYGLLNNISYKHWKRNRQSFTHLLAPKFMDTVINSANNLYEELSEYWHTLGIQRNNNVNADNWALEIDFPAWLYGYSNDLISILITGERTYSMVSYYNKISNIKSKFFNALIEDEDTFVQSIIKHIDGVEFFMFINPFIRHYAPIIRDKSISILKNRDYLFGRLRMVIKKRREEIEKMSADTEMKTDMLTSLIIANKIRDTDSITDKPMNDEEIRGNLLEAFMGGTETGPNAFCYITYYLCKHPHIKQKVLSEIDSVFPKSSNKFSVTHDDLLKLKYCEAVIKETLRLMPVIGLNTRYVTEECKIAGYKWPAGTLFHLDVLSTNRDPELWPNPEVYDPDRFYNNDQSDKKFLPIFGGGLRICPGRKLAVVELLILMASVYKNFNLDLTNTHESLKISTNGVIPKVLEMNVRISPRI
ncbi:13855_t:CDS:2 [Racocetra persica]|uniref:13855_t:CDS:1 n=2 Tax=Racocetra persica TaxID=160502 RepID=A0ACA9L3P1_9GLOM|nr:13854_t:CDS:2 [Racocetra persica]CAG8505886.1 13855_t:CDS:2 [Racocetra persica]